MSSVPTPLGRHAFAAGTLLAAAMLSGCGGGDAARGGQDNEQPARSSAGAHGGAPEITVLSTRADLVSGGDALLEVKLPKPADAQSARVTLNGADVTDRFAVRPNGRYQGLVTGLRVGTNDVVASVSIGASQHAATLTVTNHSKQGPIISGPQVEPYICETELFGLEASTPPKCEAPTRYEFFYKPVGSSVTDPFKIYDTASPPALSEIATTTTDQGKTVPFIVRRERGVIDRGVYDIAVLHMPGEGSSAANPPSAWNGKLLMLFNSGTKRWHRQSINGDNPDVLLVTDSGYTTSYAGGDIALARGLAVMSSTITQVDNPITSTESVMMVKEHLIENYGPVRYTIALGCSGGSMMQHLTASNYPGLIDGIIPICPLPDMWTAIMNHAAFDYPLLNRYFSQLSPALWTDKSERIAVYGGLDVNPNPNPSSGLSGWYRPTSGCSASSPATEPAWVYDPISNPGGVRCALQDKESQILGSRAPEDWGPIEQQIGRGFTGSPVDNVGVQYGLRALKDGQISPEQFVDLNVKVGGVDIDGNWTAARKKATLEALRNLYRSGQVTDGRQLDSVPMIHRHTFVPTDAYHPLVATDMMRARLIKANGHADNLVTMVTVDDPGAAWQGAVTSGPMNRASLLAMDQWLAGMEADRSAAPLSVKVLRHKPKDLVDSCWANGQPGAACPEVFKYPKMVADAPVASDIMKCQLKPIDWNAYGAVTFTDDQKQRLQQAFPEGVCDWSKPGVEQQPSIGTWLTFARRIGGEPIGPEPKSTRVVGRH